ncbi:hypothetical protein LY78DRAFT_17933 [Colletotrichum sublineola]|nr:hypothetical protein LY78DRAFT_17933 [Colletotrichum sublineola]
MKSPGRHSSATCKTRLAARHLGGGTLIVVRLIIWTGILRRTDIEIGLFDVFLNQLQRS